MESKITLDGIDYIGRKDGDRIILEPAPKIVVPRLANAPVGTPVEVTHYYTGWVKACFEKYHEDEIHKWECGSYWINARLLLNYRYAWDPSWKLFMEDKMKVRIYFCDDETGRVITEVNFVHDLIWDDHFCPIMQFEVLSYEK